MNRNQDRETCEDDFLLPEHTIKLNHNEANDLIHLIKQ